MPIPVKEWHPFREGLPQLDAAALNDDYAAACWVEGYRIGRLAVYVPTPRLRWTYVARSELQGHRFSPRARKCCA